MRRQKTHNYFVFPKGKGEIQGGKKQNHGENLASRVVTIIRQRSLKPGKISDAVCLGCEKTQDRKQKKILEENRWRRQEKNILHETPPLTAAKLR